MKQINYDNNCIFCKIINKQISSFFVESNKHTLAILDAFPASKGHIIIISKMHYQNLENTDDCVLSEILLTAKIVTKKLKKAFPEIQGFNYLSNQNKIAGQSVFHTHLHVIPKYTLNEGFCFSQNNLKSEKLNLSEIYNEILKN